VLILSFWLYILVFSKKLSIFSLLENRFFIFILIYIRMTAWNDFVKKIYHEGKKNNAAYQFKNALKDASARKGEMGKMAAAPAMAGPKKSKKRGKSKGKKRKSGTRRKRGKR
jgi:hypothetical protein